MSPDGNPYLSDEAELLFEKYMATCGKVFNPTVEFEGIAPLGNQNGCRAEGTWRSYVFGFRSVSIFSFSWMTERWEYCFDEVIILLTKRMFCNEQWTTQSVYRVKR